MRAAVCNLAPVHHTIDLGAGIWLPEQSGFDDAEDYYRVAWHELAHRMEPGTRLVAAMLTLRGRACIDAYTFEADGRD